MPQSAAPHRVTAPALPPPPATGKRYLLVLDRDLLAAGEQPDLEPINHLLARQQQEPCEVVVLSLVSTHQERTPSMQLPGTKRGVFPRAPRPDYDVSAAAEHRMDLAVQHLQTTGCRASGLISEEDLVKAVHSEIRARRYDKIILATGREGGRRPARAPRPGPVHQLRRRLGQRLIILPPARGTSPPRELTVSLSVPRSADHLPTQMVAVPCGPAARRRQEQDVTRREQ
jgi:hypothetical protein